MIVSGLELLKINIEWKKKLHAFCVLQLEEKLVEVNTELSSLASDLATAAKSTAGDKHETSRAMIHLEQERLGHVYENLTKQLQFINQIKLVDLSGCLQLGSLIQTNEALFYISIGLGKLKFDGREVYVISPIAPIAKAMLNANEGLFLFNANEYQILKNV